MNYSLFVSHVALVFAKTKNQINFKPINESLYIIYATQREGERERGEWRSDRRIYLYYLKAIIIYLQSSVGCAARSFQFPAVC